MADTLFKLTPDRDLQCYFEQPSAVAAISDAASDQFTVSGCWRQQFDWAVIEWNRNNVFEHPAFRYLPDGDLSGLVLSYEERRTNCIPVDSDLYPTVDWPYLRIWCDGDPKEQFHRVPLLKYAEPIEGEYAPATTTFQLIGQSAAAGFVALSWMWEHYVADVAEGDPIDDILDNLAANINAHSMMMRAEQGRCVQLRLNRSRTAVGSCGAVSLRRDRSDDLEIQFAVCFVTERVWRARSHHRRPKDAVDIRCRFPAGRISALRI
jgi:hypothetical protein